MLLTGIIIYQIIAGLIMCGFFLENADADISMKTIVTWLFINLVIGFVTLPMQIGSILARLSNNK
jgi:hypothetical protein